MSQTQQFPTKTDTLALQPRKFKNDSNGVNYKLGGILNHCERGPSNLEWHTIEFKEFSGETLNDVSEYEKPFITKLIKFACGCLNRRCDGTIYFGVADEKIGKHKHGEVVGMKHVTLNQVNQFQEWLEAQITGNFPQRFRSLKKYAGWSDMAKAFSRCVGPVRAISIEGSDWLVLEIDVEASGLTCQAMEFYFRDIESDSVLICMRQGTETINSKDLSKWTKEIEYNAKLRRGII